MKPKKKRASKYEPLVKTDLSFDELLKLAAHTKPPEETHPHKPLIKKKPKKK